MTTNTDGKATIRAAALHRILAHAAPFTAPAHELPVLRTVRLFADGKDLAAEATDRFTACRSRVEAEEVSDGFSVLVANDDVKRLLALTKSAGRTAQPQRPVALDLVDGALTVTDDWGGASLACRAVDAEYPRLGSIIDKARDDQPGQRDVIHLNPDVFTVLTKALGKSVTHATFKLPSRKAGGVYVTVAGSDGDGFEAVLMLRRGES